jgi:M6 family metalloprotease-like protein
MKKSSMLWSICFLATLVGTMGLSTAAPYEPEGREIVWGQGPPLAPTMQLRLRVFGDEYYARTETLAGYTVIYSFQDNSYYYAQLSQDGTSLESTGTLANLLPPAGLARKIDIAPFAVIQNQAGKRAIYDAERKARWDTRVSASQIVRSAAAGASFPSNVLATARNNSRPVTGSVVGLTILVKFSDTTPTFDQLKIRNMFNQGTAGAPGIPAITGTYTQDGNVGSVNNYFAEQSSGKLNLVQLVTTVVNLPNNRAFYNYIDEPTNNEIEPDARVVGQRILNAAINSLVADGFNFSPLSVDASGRILVTNLIVASQDSGSYMQGIWPHSGSLTTPVTFGTEARPRRITEYTMRTVGSTPITIGSLCHDNAQMLLGFPDLYAYPNMGVGNQCLMGTGSDGSAGSAAVPASAGSPTTPATPAVPAIPVSSANGGRRPAPINPHFKDLVGWNTVTEITTDQIVNVTLPTATATAGVAYRVRKPNSLTESFIVENRSTSSKWIAAPLDTGVAVWHINDAKNGNIFTSPGEIYGVSLEQADGLSNLESSIVGTNSNAGDSGDLFDLTKPIFTDTTTPSALWFDGTTSSFQTRVLAVNAASSDVAFGAFVPANTIIVDTPNGDEFAFWKNVFPITWSANITGNVKIELYKAGVFRMLIANNVSTATRRYNWTVPNTLPPAADYKIRITSLTNSTIVFDESNNPFNISDVAFPRGEAIPYGWVKPADSAATWTVSNRDAVDGSFSLAAIKPRDRTKTGISYTSNFEAGTVSFYLKVSTEADYDFARFYIDGVEQTLGGVLGISGKTDWLQYEFPVGSGNHTFTWTYEKDDSFGGLNDSVFLDTVKLPPTTQEIAVEAPVGTTLESGVSAITMPNTTIGLTSATQTITITNTGFADLFALAITTEGTDTSDFVLTKLLKTALLPGESTSFNVSFKPKTAGSKTASLVIASNDTDESSFTIALQGMALGLPQIAVSEPSGPAMKDGKATRSFGSVPVGSTGATQTYTITNNGEGELNNLVVTKSGKAIADFEVGALSSTTVAPFGTATFTITFAPTGLKARKASIAITSNDAKSGPFNFTVSGTGTKPLPIVGSGSFSSSSSFSMESGVTVIGMIEGFEIIEGKKYNSLRITKGMGNVEVSSDLLNWFSGSDYTTVVSDDGAMMTVRDNTPVTEEAKRYIRVK